MPETSIHTKPHFLILDGLRGVAAILVVIFHLFEAYYPTLANHPMPHGYLAVDFFFLLSGFVIGYAYDDRWGNMTIWDFCKIRLIRLHPMVLLGVLIGTIGFFVDPFTNGMQHVSVLQLIGVMLISFTLLPAPDIRGWGETHSLNGPCWSLLQEYIANVVYALFVRKFSKFYLWILVIISGIILTCVASYRGDVATGWGFNSFWIALVRMCFPFFAGLLLFRTNKWLQIPMAFPACSLLLLLCFFLPNFRFNGLYEAGCIMFLFPFIVSIGAGGTISGNWAKLCRFAGAISYPIYITHYPFIYIYTMWIGNKKPPTEQIIPVAIGLFILFLVIAYLSLKWFDEPVRKWLKKFI